MKVGLVTGSRSDYGLLKPLINALDKDNFFDLKLFVTGSHLDRRFGHTLKEIKKDGFKVAAKINCNSESMSRIVSLSCNGFDKKLNRIKPDLLIVLGDRVEIMGAVLAAYYQNIPIAHIHGGDVSQGGHADDSIRHAITKLSHVHFPVSKKSADRIIKLGEEKSRVHVVGAPGLESLDVSHDVREKYGIPNNEPFLLVAQNPISTEIDVAHEQIRETLNAVKRIDMHSIIVYPNADSGGLKIINEIDDFQSEKFHKFKNVDHEDYVSLLKYCSAIVGNSSGALIEAPHFKTPAVNVGNRQLGREQTINVINCANKEEDVYQAILKAVSPKFRSSLKNLENPYGDGKTSTKIISVLKKLKIDKKLLQKKITY